MGQNMQGLVALRRTLAFTTSQVGALVDSGQRRGMA